VNWCSRRVRTLSDCQDPYYTQRCCQTCLNLEKVATTQPTRPSSTVTTQSTTLRTSLRVLPQPTTLRTSTGKPSRYVTSHKPLSATISLCMACTLSMVEILKHHYRWNFLTILSYSVLATTQNKNFAQVSLPFDFGVVNTTDKDGEQQVPSVALCLQQLTTPATRRQSCSV